jgi:hypothetical protein
MLNLPWYLWLSFKMGLNRSYNLLLGERVLPISITWNPSTLTTQFPNKINTFVKTRNRTMQYTNMNSQFLLTHLLLMIWSTSRFFLTCKTHWFDLQLTFIHITIIWIYIYIYIYIYIPNLITKGGSVQNLILAKHSGSTIRPEWKFLM